MIEIEHFSFKLNSIKEHNQFKIKYQKLDPIIQTITFAKHFVARYFELGTNFMCINPSITVEEDTTLTTVKDLYSSRKFPNSSIAPIPNHWALALP